MIESYDLVCYKGVYSLDNRIYHNTFYQNHWGMVGSPDMPQLDRNVIKNNIFYLNETFEIRWRTQNAVDGNYFGGNSILGGDIEWYPAGYQSLSYLQNNYPEFWFGNISENPMFTDEHSHDLTLKPGSPMIERGLFLTKTTDAGSGVSIPVKDARYFMDGWGIIEGDIIQLERNPQTARIIAVDYEENILIVDVSLSWEAGQGVSLDFKGYSPDIGAFEFDPEKKKRKAQR